MNKQNLITIVIIVLIAAAGFVIYQNLPENTEPVAVSGVQSQLSLDDLRRLKIIQLDTSLLTDPLFTSLTLPPKLTEFKVSVELLTSGGANRATSTGGVGRLNPFLPL